MSSSVPRGGRGAMTPTGKLQPPPPVSGRNTGRRGLTPRSACKANSGLGSSISTAPKPKLTAEQQLDIIQKIETGNYRKGEGLQQFYNEIAASNAKPKCSQNLYTSFALVDNPLAASTRNYGNGMAGSAESLSMTSSVISSVPSMADTEVTSIGVSNEGDAVNSDFVLPNYIKVYDRLYSAKECYYRSLNQLAELQVKSKFAAMIPQERMLKFVQSLDKIQKIIRKFLDGNASENMQLFLPSTSNKGSTSSIIHCDIEHHRKVIQSIFRLSEILEGLDDFLQRDPKEFKLDVKLDNFKDLVNQLEDTIKTQELYVVQAKDLLKKAAILNQDSTLSAAGIEILDDESL